MRRLCRHFAQSRRRARARDRQAELLPQGLGICRRGSRRHRPHQDRAADRREVRRRGAVHRGHHLQLVQPLQPGDVSLSGGDRGLSQGPALAHHGRRREEGSGGGREQALPGDRRHHPRRVHLRRAAGQARQGKHHRHQVQEPGDLLRRRHRHRQPGRPGLRRRRSRDPARQVAEPRGSDPRQPEPERQPGAVLPRRRPDDGEEQAGRSGLRARS